MSDHDWSDIDIPDDLRELPEARPIAEDCVPWRTLASPNMSALEELGATPGLGGLPTGIVELDELLDGLKPGRLIVAAGLAGAGKSVFLGDVFRAWMNLKCPSVMVTLEMTRDEVWRRQASAACTIDHKRITSGDLDDGDWTRLARWVGDTDDAPSWVCDRPRMSLHELEQLILAGVAEHGWQGAVVDYAQIIRHRASTREREVAEIAAGLKEIARRAEIPLVVGAQLNREATKRTGGVPKLSDMRESAALEHEADQAILVHRPDYDDDDSPRRGEADLIVAKNRGGPKDTVTVAAQFQWQRFKSFAREELAACVSCFRQHPGAVGSKCHACAKPRGKP